MYNNLEALFGGTGPLLELIESIYAAVESPERWPTVLATMADAMRGESLAMFTMFPDSRVSGILALHQMSQESWNDFESYYSILNPIMPRAEGLLRDGQTAYTQAVITDKELEHTEFYADFFRRNDMHHSVGIRFLDAGTYSANLSCQRSKATGPFDERADVVYQALKPHLHRALTLYLKLNLVSTQATGYEASLDAFGHAVFAVDGRGKILFANRHGETTLRAEDSLRIADGSLEAVDRASDRRLQACLQSWFALGPLATSASTSSLQVARTNGQAPLLLTLLPATSCLSGVPWMMTALILVTDPSQRPPSRSHLLGHLFGLNPAEVRVAALLLEGLDTRAIAEHLRITQETCRFYIKRILQKTGTSRQVELQRLLLSLPGSLAHEPPSVT